MSIKLALLDLIEVTVRIEIAPFNLKNKKLLFLQDSWTSGLRGSDVFPDLSLVTALAWKLSQL